MNEALRRAKRGAAFLDEKLGRSWRRKIRRRQLDMASGCGCILGQLSPHGDYEEGLSMVGLDWQAQEDVPLGFEEGSTGPTYDDLTDAWLEVLRRG